MKQTEIAESLYSKNDSKVEVWNYWFVRSITYDVRIYGFPHFLVANPSPHDGCLEHANK